ncbi:MAG: hypothetical protein NTU73_04500 [Ignavibacteriae bacterium]|nr:hypothetical protein [Ignavibacteriota bacterium]
MSIKKILFIIILICLGPSIFAQGNEVDTIKKQEPQLKMKKTGGIFISPILGAEFPIKDLHTNSKYTFCLGGKLEYSSLSIYPFVIGATIQYQNHGGADDFKTKYLINSLNTKITSFGVSFDILLNKYLKSSFTIPFVFIEVRSISVKREVSPEANFPNLKSSDNTIGFGGGVGFTLYIFDIYTTYLSAKDYSTISIKTRFRFPLLKF